MDETLVELAERLQSGLDCSQFDWKIEFGELTVHVGRDDLVAVLKHLRDDGLCQFKQLTTLTAIDHPQRPERFEVVYQLLSHKHNQRLRVKVSTDEETAVPSVTPFLPGGFFITWQLQHAFPR